MITHVLEIAGIPAICEYTLGRSISAVFGILDFYPLLQYRMLNAHKFSCDMLPMGSLKFSAHKLQLRFVSPLSPTIMNGAQKKGWA